MQRLTACLMLIFAASFASGCQTAPPGNCAGWRQINPAPADVTVISAQLARDVIAHNRHGRGLGCW